MTKAKPALSQSGEWKNTACVLTLLRILINIKRQIQLPTVAETSLQHSPSYTFSIHSALCYLRQWRLRIIQKIKNANDTYCFWMTPLASHRAPVDSLQLFVALAVPGRFINFATRLHTAHTWRCSWVLLDPGYLWKQWSCRRAMCSWANKFYRNKITVSVRHFSACG